ncbi:hypothetical protein AWV79_20275 [Cupriavidus sp. UYMMa02A]|nr:hypothetical protein AWV79_20275 [Cupriavidus sp. UYMMa02A]
MDDQQEQIYANRRRLAELFANCADLKAVADGQQGDIPLHFIAAGLMFACLAYVAIYRAKDTLNYLPVTDDKEARDRTKRRYTRTYRFFGGLMIAFPLIGLLLSWVMGQRDAVVFFVEAAGIWTFGAYWFVKSCEMALSAGGEKEVARKMTADKGLADANAAPGAAAV